jgi:hypothetical protein
MSSVCGFLWNANTSVDLLNILYLEVFTSHTDRQVTCSGRYLYLIQHNSGLEGLLDALYAHLSLILDAFKFPVNEHIWLTGRALALNPLGLNLTAYLKLLFNWFP